MISREFATTACMTSATDTKDKSQPSKNAYDISYYVDESCAGWELKIRGHHRFT